ncbi:antitoxin [Streptomyces sp. NBC_00162]|uniref:antitoxin n=1 Tax=Streptomyces sp. NBC_00162 TaxID=2903629 RepID=UPI00214C3B37|nr:antitoxin [Streptomyces sp. NBC_00162]UUU41671.1 antitoxin [Streptomyces sp. NBC_00162]
MRILDKARELLHGHSKQAKQASDAAEQQINQRTDSKYAKQVDQGQQQVEKQLGIDDDPNR